MNDKRQPAGIPVGGQFAANDHDEASGSLSGGSAVLVDDALIIAHAKYDTYPVPQADSLSRMSLALDALNAGVEHPETVAESIGTVGRQGAYYLNAIGYLGLAEKDSEGSYHLTELGEEVAGYEDSDRITALSQVVSHAPLVRAINEDDDVALEQHLGRLESEETIERRMMTARRWAEASSNVESISSDYAGELAEYQGGFAEAAQRSSEVIRTTRMAGAAREPKFCDVHFTQLPISGVCDQCEDER